MPEQTDSVLKDGQKEWLIFIVAIIAAVLIMLGGRILSAHKDNKASTIIQNMAPHRATYKIELKSLHSGQHITNVNGEMTYEWNVTCDASISNHHFDMVYEYQTGSPVNLVSNFSTYELHNGRALEFSSQRIKNGQLADEIRGRTDHKTGIITYTKPMAAEETLSPNVLFPTSHTQAIIVAIQKRKKFLPAYMFDGGDIKGAVEVGTFIAGKASPVKPEDYAGGINQTLLRSPAYNLRLAFFPVTGNEGKSEYEMSAIFHENGIIRDVLIEYDGFSVVQKLVALEKLDRQCDS